MFGERQFLLRNPIAWVLVPVLALAVTAAFFHHQARPAVPFLGVLSLLILSSNLHVRIDVDAVRIRFFPFWRRTIPRSKIRAARAVAYRWWRYGGWGIRWGMDRTMGYHVWGRLAVRLAVDGKRFDVVVGTRRPEAFMAAIGLGGAHSKSVLSVVPAKKRSARRPG